MDMLLTKAAKQMREYAIAHPQNHDDDLRRVRHLWGPPREFVYDTEIADARIRLICTYHAGGYTEPFLVFSVSRHDGVAPSLIFAMKVQYAFCESAETPVALPPVSVNGTIVFRYIVMNPEVGE